MDGASPIISEDHNAHHVNKTSLEKYQAYLANTSLLLAKKEIHKLPMYQRPDKMMRYRLKTFKKIRNPGIFQNCN